jgi:polyhydroxybutyrate depolymerase
MEVTKMSMSRLIFIGIGVVGLCCATACSTEYKSASSNAGTTATGPVDQTDWGKVASSGSGASVTASPATGTAATTATNPTVGAGGSGAVIASAAGRGGSSVRVTAGTGPVGGAAGGATEPTTGAAGTPTTPVEKPITCPAPGALKVGDTNDTIKINGVTRNYIVHVPASYKGDKPVPLVTDWHPILFDNTTERNVSGMSAKSDQEGFIVVWPNGIDNAWNVGSCCTTERTVDDVGFAKGLVAKLSSQLCIDPKRVYANGYSMGGGMSLKLACDATDLIAASAPASFDLMVPSEQTCTPSRPISIFSTRGQADMIVPYAGGPTSPPNGLNVTVTFMGAQENAKWWANFDGCTEGPSAADNNNCIKYTKCKEGTEVVLCTVIGGIGHVPGDANLIWPFLSRFTLP